MAYNLRERKQKAVYVDSDSDSDSYADPDYARRQPRRQQTRGPVKSPFANSKQGQGVQMANFCGGAGSGRGMAGFGGPVRKRSGRPPKKAETPIQDNIAQVQRVRSGAKERAAPNTLKTRPAFSSYSMLRNDTEKRTILALLIDLEIVEECEEVYYCDWSGGKSTVRGRITRCGIFCTCCKDIITVSEFQLHAGSVDRTMPYNNIVAAHKKLSLMQSQTLAWYKGTGNGSILIDYSYNTMNEDKSDDACIICADGGDLICCSECPLTYHIDCLYMTNVPKNNWVCPCCLCTHCGQAGTKFKNITECKLCGKTYHLACHGNPFVKVSHLCSKFCGDACIYIDRKLKNILGVKNELGGGFSWTLLHHFNLLRYDQSQPYDYVRTECNSKITIAWEMMNQCFEPVVDRLTGVNILKHVIYNTSSTLTRIDFKGFHTAILEKGDEIVAAACIRLRGVQIAEMPFVATHESCRNQGMLTKLMSAIETALCNMSIEHLVIPSAEDVQKMWIKKFKFSPIPASMEFEIALSKLLMFPNSVRLQKPLVNVAAGSARKELPFDLNLEPPEEDDGEMGGQSLAKAMAPRLWSAQDIVAEI